jgi:hypothetical protein
MTKKKKQTLQILKKLRPSCSTDLRGVLKYRYLDSGCFRSVYLLPDIDCVIKFPIASKHHSRREVLISDKIRRRHSLRHLVRYIPKIHYADLKTGVVVMERLFPIKVKDRDSIDIIKSMFKDSLGCRYGGDIHWSNSGRNRRGQIKVLDLGLI